MILRGDIFHNNLRVQTGRNNNGSVRNVQINRTGAELGGWCGEVSKIFLVLRSLTSVLTSPSLN